MLRSSGHYVWLILACGRSEGNSGVCSVPLKHSTQSGRRPLENWPGCSAQGSRLLLLAESLLIAGSSGPYGCSDATRHQRAMRSLIHVVFIPKESKTVTGDPKSVWPISLTSFLLKMLEKIVLRHIRDGAFTVLSPSCQSACIHHQVILRFGSASSGISNWEGYRYRYR